MVNARLATLTDLTRDQKSALRAGVYATRQIGWPWAAEVLYDMLRTAPNAISLEVLQENALPHCALGRGG